MQEKEEVEADDNDDNEEHQTPDHRYSRRCNSVCNEQHFAKAEEFEFLEGEHDLFHQGRKEQLCEHNEAPALAMPMVDMSRRHEPRSRNLHNNAIADKARNFMQNKQMRLW